MKVYELSASRSGTDKTSGTVRFKLADNATVDTNNPITIPSSGYTYSFTKQIRMYCASAPDTKIDNLRLYTDGSNNFGTGVDVLATNTGTTFSANATSAMSGQDLFGFTSAAPFDMDSVASADVTATGFVGDICRMQMRVSSLCSPGTLSSETVTLAYDEI